MSSKAAFVGLSLLVASGSACSVELREDKSRPAVLNTCKADADCGANGYCYQAACFTRFGDFEEVLLEVIPEANSAYSGLAFLSIQDNVKRGDRDRNVTFSGLSTFVVQVQINWDELPTGCSQLRPGTQSIPARVEFIRTGTVGSTRLFGLQPVRISVDTVQQSTGFSKEVSLVPGTYDIYIQPVSTSTCQLPPRILYGVDVARQGQVPPSAPPATLELSVPARLEGKVERKGGSLADWQVDLIEPQEGRVISTSARLGPTTDASPVTNFALSYERLSSSAGHGPARYPLLRLTPPKDAAATSPTIYFDLASTDITGVGQANLILSGLPTAAQLVQVSGQVRSQPDDTAGIPSTLQFFTSSIGTGGLTASFGHSITTDATGRYTTKLFPGTYRIVATPTGISDLAAPSEAAARREWAITEAERMITADSGQVADVVLVPTRLVDGVAVASKGNETTPALGATLEVKPSISPNTSSVLRLILQPPASLPSTSVPVNDKDGTFSLPLDSGEFDLLLRPADKSNFAWWVWPSVRVAPADFPGDKSSISPKLRYPVPLEGIISVARDGASEPLRNATVRAYAPVATRAPEGARIARVGEARTDDEGRYYLRLPPSFGGQ